MDSHRVLLAAAVGLLVACRGPEPIGSPPGSSFLTGTPLPITRLGPESRAFAFYSGLESAQNVVIRDAAAWSQLWQEIYRGSSPVPPVPDIAFDREMIVAAAMGSRSSGGYNILITRAAEDTSGVQVEVVQSSPGNDCVVTLALTQPVDLARMPRRDGAVRFVVEQRVHSCGS